MKGILFLFLLSLIHPFDLKAMKQANKGFVIPTSNTSRVTPTLSHLIPQTSTVTTGTPVPTPRPTVLSLQEHEKLINQIFPRECGIEKSFLIPPVPHRRSKRVVNGNQARKGQFPWQVALLFKGTQYCGGSVVHERYIVTGAHCFNPSTSYKPDDWVVRAGDHRLRDRDMFEVEMEVENITLHEHYKSMWFEGITDTPPMNDVAIVKLKNPLRFNTWHIQPICLLRPNITFNWGEKCTVSGWGHLQWNGSQPNILNYAQVPLVSHSNCNIPKAYNGTVHGTALCAGYPQGLTDACEYDSGGPLSCKKCGRFYLTGVVSWGHECARPYKYGVYAHMKVLTTWVVDRIAKEESSNAKKFRSG